MCYFLTKDPTLCRRRLKGGALVLLFMWLSANALHAQAVIGETGTESTLVKWAITQGGPSVLVILIGLSYRRDLLGVISKQDQFIAVLTELVKQTAQVNERVMSAVEALRVEVRRLDEHR